MKKKDSEASNELLKTGLVYSKSAAAGEVLLDASTAESAASCARNLLPRGV